MFELINKITTGDVRELMRLIPDESIDLIFTDPPYEKDSMWTWDYLGECSQRILRPNGILITFAGKMFLPEIYSLLSKHLSYFWTMSLVFNFGGQRIWSKKIFEAWRPIICYTKGEFKNETWMPDARFGKIKDKRFHKWGQEMAIIGFYLESFLKKKEIVLDPFVGGGTVAAVCKMLGYNYIAFEIDPETAELARERVRNTQPPLFILEPEQLEFHGYDKSS